MDYKDDGQLVKPSKKPVFPRITSTEQVIVPRDINQDELSKILENGLKNGTHITPRFVSREYFERMKKIDKITVRNCENCHLQGKCGYPHTCPKNGYDQWETIP